MPVPVPAPIPVPIRDPVPSESSKDLAIRRNPYFTQEVSGAVCCFSIDFLYEKEMSEGGDLHENGDFL